MTADAPDLVDRGALRAALEDRLGGVETFEFEPIDRGAANETYALAWGGRDLILRRPPIEGSAPELLHGLRREYDVLSALAPTWVPTPEALLYCEDEGIIGDEFYLMERLDGEVVTDEEPDRFAADEHRQRVGEETIDALARIHHVDPGRAGLSDLGDPDDFAARQVDLLIRQLDWAEEATAEVRRVDRLHDVADWLEANAPESEHGALVHGDYKPDNLMWAPGTPPRIAGVLDWEMVTLGDPLTDLGWLLSYWHEPRDPSPLTDEVRERWADHDLFPFLEEYVANYSRFMQQPGYPTRRELVERYEVGTGIEFADERFYRALGVFKLGVICEGFFRRHVEGSPSAKDSYPVMGLVVPTLAEQATQIIEGDLPL